MAFRSLGAGETLAEPYRIPSALFFTDSDTGALADLPPHVLNDFPILPGARVLSPDRSTDTGRSRRFSLKSLRLLPESIVAPPPKPSQVRCLPLLDAAIDVRVDCIIATTRFVQRFTNISDIIIREAHYTFPIYDGATVISMRFCIGDSDVLVGRVLSNEEAKIEYQRAIEELEAAALLEEQTPEVFQTKIGNIPPKTSVKIEITYVNVLKLDVGSKGHLVTIPTSLAPRYGTPPVGTSTSSSVVPAGLAIVIAVNSDRPIREIECRSHPASVTMGSAGAPPDLVDFSAFYAEASKKPPPDTNCEGTSFDSCQATVKLSDPDAKMEKDFVVLVKTARDNGSMAGSQAVLSRVNEQGHAALLVTIQPSELFGTYKPQMDFKGEIVFLADRSGSMSGEKIAGLREALQVFLKSLPTTCHFNIYSFGSSLESIWGGSKPYSQASLDEAVAHVAEFEANLGGTELLPALRSIVAQRSATLPSTQVIILTDGEVWEANAMIDFVQSTRSELGDKFRLFALGIGNSVSHRIIEGTSRAGGGFGEVVGIASPDKWQHRVIGMLRGALMPASWDVELSLGAQFAQRDLNAHPFRGVDVKANDRQSNRHHRLSHRLKFAMAPSRWSLERAASGLGLSHNNNSQDQKVVELENEGDATKPEVPSPLLYIQAPTSRSIHHFQTSSVFFLLDIGSAAAPSEIAITATSSTNRADMSRVILPVVSATTQETHLQHLAVKAALLDLDIRTSEEEFLRTVKMPSVGSRNAVLLGKMYSVTSKWTSFVATKQDGSIAHAIQSYDAIIGDLEILTATSRYSTSSKYPPNSIRTAPAHGVNLGSTYSSPAPMAYHSIQSIFHGSRAAMGLPSLSTHAQMPYQSRQAECERSRSETLTSASYSLDRSMSYHNAQVSASPLPYFPSAHGGSATETPELDFNNIVQSQAASGRFQISPEMRDKLADKLPAGTREAIRTDMKGDEDEDEEAVDTKMVAMFIETKMDDKKDMLELMVEKANRSVAIKDPARSKDGGNPDGGGSAS